MASIMLLCIASIATSTSLGVVGSVFPVAEQSLLALIQDHAPQVKKLETTWLQQVAQYGSRPTPVNLPRAIKNSTHQQPRLNALQQLPSYQPHWLFINADDKAQLRWLKKQLHANSKVILTGGSVNDTATLLHRDIFFDQAGRISYQLGITHVPAQVTRQGDALSIAEIVVSEDGL